MVTQNTMPRHSKCIPQEIAAIDLGSNSFHMVIARIVNGALQVLGRLKKRVHLAEGLDSNNLLSQEAMERGLSCLALFAKRLQGFSPDNIRVVATHALRQAANADVFLQRAALVIPYPIEIISSHEEALLIFRGVEHTQPEKGRKLVIDIGGGSTELVIGEDFKPLVVESRPIGCVSFAKKFFPDGEINKINFQRAQLATTQKLETLAAQYKIQGWQYALGTSGSIKAVTEILLAMGEKDGLITAKRLQLLRDQVLQFNHVNRLKLPGLPEDRRSIFIPGLAIISGIFDTLAINTLRFSDSALREGVLYEMEGPFRYQDIRQRTAQSLVDHYNIDRNQARRVMQTSQQLYAQWQMQNSKLVQPHLTPLLKWAAMLHEVGLSINHSAIQRHSAYILQNTNLPGFNQEQQLLLAMLVRFHRKTIKLEELPKFNLFKKKNYLPLIQLLRLSTLLNNQRQATTMPESLQLITHDNHWTLRFPQDYLTQNNLLALDFEREQAYWNNVTDWQLTIE